MAEPPPHVPPREPRESPRARLQGGGDDDDAVRHGHAQRPRPLPSRRRRDRPRARRRRARGVAATGDARPPPALPRVDARARRGPPGRPGLGLAVLVVNAGSTSLKLHVVEDDDTSARVTSWGQSLGRVHAVAHRVVHGGARFREPVLIDDDVRREIHELESLAPLHNAPAVRAIEDAEQALPDVPHVAVFDTAFHATIPDEAATYALPQRWRDWGIRRYGFHGLSVQWCSEQVRVARLVVCHLGGGSSITAGAGRHRGRTAKGLRPLEGGAT